MTQPSPQNTLVHWIETQVERSAGWRSENGAAPPKNIVIGDDTLTADAALRLARAGTAILWRGDFHNARQLLQAMARRSAAVPRRATEKLSITEIFHQGRMMQAQRARLLGLLLMPIEAGHHLPLRRAPDVVAACTAAYGPAEAAYIVSLRELQGVMSAHEWRVKGVEIAALNDRIHAHYGVFSPLRGEYVDLVAQTPLPSNHLAFDIGTGSGVLAAVLARRGVAHIVATDQDARALACARENMKRMGLDERVEVTKADLFPDGRAGLVVCNPPWLPGRPSSALEYAIYDPDSRMLTGFLTGLAAHLEPGGEGWLILSDLAEHLGLRTREHLLQSIAAAGLRILGRQDARPCHPRAADENDPLYAARAAETTSLWRLAAA